MNRKLKEKFSKISIEIVDNLDKTKPKTRTRPMLCPICKDTFFVYEDLARAKARTGLEPDIEPEYPRDATGFVRFRDTCGDSDCYFTEEKRCLRLSLFDNIHNTQQEQVERPKGLTPIKKGLFNDIK